MDFLFFSVCVPVSLITTPSNCPLLGKNLLPGPLTPCCQIPARLFSVARSRPAYFLLPDPSALTPCCQISAPLFQVARSQPAYSLLPDPGPLTPCCQIPGHLHLFPDRAHSLFRGPGEALPAFSPKKTAFGGHNFAIIIREFKISWRNVFKKLIILLFISNKADIRICKINLLKSYPVVFRYI